MPMTDDRSVLVVDDDDAIRTLIARVLMRANYDVAQAGNGSEALTKLRARRFQTVVLDLMMPVMSGPELLRTLKQRGQLDGLPVVVVSAGGMPEEAPEARAFLRKPPSPDQLRTLAKQYCGGERDAAG